MCSRHGTARAPLCRQINRVFLLRPRQAEGGFPEQSVGRVSEPTPFPKLLFNTPPTRQVFLRITIIKHSGEPGIVSREPTTEFAGPVDPGAGPLPRRGTWGVGVPGSGPQRHARTDRAVRQVVTCPLPMALAACGKRWTGGSCLHNPRPVHPRRVRPHAPALAHGSPRARGREGGGDTGPRASSSSVSSRFGLCAPKSTKSSPSLPSAAPQGHSDKRQPQDPSLSKVWSRSGWASTARRVSLPQGNAEHTRERAGERESVSARIQRGEWSGGERGRGRAGWRGARTW